MGNPFDRRLLQTSTDQESQNPFDRRLRGPVGGSLLFPDDTPVIPEFIQGLKEGLLTPFRVLGRGPGEEIDSSHPVAKQLGEFGGAVLSFIPIFKGTSIAMRGFGLTARLTPNVARVVEGAASFGLFEAGASEEFKDVPEEFVKGAAIGAAFEVGLIGAAQVFRAKLPKTPEGSRVNPDGARLENSIVPNNAATEEEAVSRIMELAPKDKTPPEVAATLIAEGTSDVGIVPGIANPAEFTSFIRRNFPDLRMAIRESEPGVSEALLYSRNLTPRQIQEFARAGRFPGMEIIHGGVSKELISQTGEGVLVRGPTGLIERATTSDIQKAVQLEELSQGRLFVEGIEDTEVRTLLENALNSARELPEELQLLADRVGLRLNSTSDGRFLVRTPENIVLGEFRTPEEVRGFMRRWGPGTRRDVLSEAAQETPKIGGGAGGPPIRLQDVSPGLPEGSETPGVLQRLADSLNTLLFRITGSANYAQTAERVGHGKAFTEIHRPLQDAVLEVGRQMGRIPRSLLEGRTFNQQLERIQNFAKRITKDRFPLIKLLVETQSRQDILATRGVFGSVTGMTRAERDVAQFIEKLGLKDDVPRLLSLNRSARALDKGLKTFRKRVGKLTQNIKRLPEQTIEQRTQQLAEAGVHPEIAEQIARLEEIATDIPETYEGILEAYGLSGEEKAVMKALETYGKLSKDDFSSFVVSRYLTSPTKKEGFATIREQLIAEHGITAQEVLVADEVDLMLQAAFRESGMNAKRQIAGYWSHMSSWTEHGLVTDRFMERMVPKRTVQWTGSAFRSGELNVYESDPVLMAAKYTRGLFSKRYVEPALKRANAELKSIRGIDTRTWRVMREYINEITGTPHASFNKADATIASFLRSLGMSPSLARGRSAKIVNALASLAYGAAIPFRSALILRNYFQMVQMIPPRIGFKYFFRGIDAAIEKDGFAEVIKRNIIPTDVVPLHAGTEILPQTAERTLKPLGLLYRRLFDMGFRWYRRADDFGRAVAFFGTKARINDFLPDFMSGRISWETFASRAKINTFDSNDIAEFRRLLSEVSSDEAASYLGKQLASEAHFRYGHASHPAGWGSIYGRLFGQFGTWPVQYKDFMLNGLARGSAKDSAEFFASHIAINLGMATAGAAVGLNLWSWVSFPSLTYTGGPFADIAIDTIKALSGSPAEKSMARKSLLFQLPTLSDPRSVFVPGSYFIADLKAALSGEVPDEQIILRAAGFKFLKPGEKGAMDWLLDEL